MKNVTMAFSRARFGGLVADEIIRDRAGKIIGRIRSDRVGNLQAYSREGHILGRYDPSTNRTYDRPGKIVAQGNTLAGFLTPQAPTGPSRASPKPTNPFTSVPEADEPVHFFEGAAPSIAEPYEDEYFEDVVPRELPLPNTCDDPLYQQAVQVVAESRKASPQWIQRRLKIGYNRAVRILDHMEADGLVGPCGAGGKREVLMAEPPPQPPPESVVLESPWPSIGIIAGVVAVVGLLYLFFRH